MSPKEARKLANNTPPEIARKLLDATRAQLQSSQAEQSASTAPAPPEEGAASEALTQLGRVLESGGDGETAQATVSAFQTLAAQNAELAARLEQIEGAARAQQNAQLRQSSLAIVGGLKEQFPGIVRGENIDPLVARDAALQFIHGRFKGDLDGAWKFAATSHAERIGAARQANTVSSSPDTTLPDAPELSSAEPIPQRKVFEMYARVERKYAGDKVAIDKAYRAIDRQVSAHNSRARK